jgi:hypothetical protein
MSDSPGDDSDSGDDEAGLSGSASDSGYSDPGPGDTSQGGSQDYLTDDDVGVAPTGAAAQAAIDAHTNPDGTFDWGDISDEMSGLPSGPLSDLADWASRQGWYSQPGAGQVGTFDFIGDLLGDRHGLEATAFQSFLTHNNLNRAADIGVGLAITALGLPGAVAMIGYNAAKGNNIADAVASVIGTYAAGPLGGLIGQTGSQIAGGRIGEAATNIGGIALGAVSPELGLIADLTGAKNFLSAEINNASRGFGAFSGNGTSLASGPTNSFGSPEPSNSSGGNELWQTILG